MDSNLLRLILLAAGVVVLVGIYFLETRRRKKKPAQAKTREMPEIGSLPGDATEQDAAAWKLEQQEPDNLESELTQLSEEVHEASSGEIEPGSLSHATTAAQQAAQQDLFAFSATEESPIDVPRQIIQLNLVAKQGVFNGPAILAAAKEVGLKTSEMQIFHRYSADGRRQKLFNMASMVEPGVFPLKAMDGFTTPGLTLFAQLPGPGDSLAIFADILFTAERLAAILNGVLQDETHSTLTKQTIENLRSQILEHRRLVQLARSRR